MVEESAISVDLRIAKLAAAQHGVVTTPQLLDLGLSVQAVSRRYRRGRLVRVYRGVYAVGHAGLSDEGRCMAAVLAVGGRAVLSHRSAAALWSLLPFAAGFPHVTVPGDGGRRKRHGIHVHRSTILAESDRTRRLNVPVTTPTRTLLDLARVVPPPELARARRQAEFLGLPLDNSRLDGTRRNAGGTDRARSDLEQRFLRLCRKHRLPPPEVNATVDRYEVDFLWRDARLIVETDGWAAHRGRVAFEEDRSRAAALALLGYEVLRLTWRQVLEEPATAAAAVRARLSSPRRAAS